jgi:hypothetical protein
MGQGVPPPERELFVVPEDSAEEDVAVKPASVKRGKARKKAAGLSLRAKPVDMDANLFNDGPDGEEGTGFARWLAGELVIEHQGDTVSRLDHNQRLRTFADYDPIPWIAHG